jgi:predicted tellurium resistance membrane protein TerC
VAVPKGYIYFAVFFSLTVEMINLRMRKKTKTDVVELNPRIKEQE